MRNWQKRNGAFPQTHMTLFWLNLSKCHTKRFMWKWPEDEFPSHVVCLTYLWRTSANIIYKTEMWKSWGSLRVVTKKYKRNRNKCESVKESNYLCFESRKITAIDESTCVLKCSPDEWIYYTHWNLKLTIYVFIIVLMVDPPCSMYFR